MPIPSAGVGKDSVIEALVKNVEAMIKADRKITAFKQLQVIAILCKHQHFTIKIYEKNLTMYYVLKGSYLENRI